MRWLRFRRKEAVPLKVRDQSLAWVHGTSSDVIPIVQRAGERATKGASRHLG